MGNDKYSHWLGRLFGFFNGSDYYAVTFGQTTYYSCPAHFVTPKWRAHEDKHKEQYRQEGNLKFLVKYIWYQIKYGYKANPYELKAGSIK